jgi:hypothetical protein
MKFSIFSHTPTTVKQNSAALHQVDFDGDPEGRVADLVATELVKRGHSIVDCLRQDQRRGDDGQARQRRDRR